MKLELKEKEAKCPKCNYLFRPVTVFKLAVPDTPDGKGPKPVKLVVSVDATFRPAKNNQSLKALLEQPLKTNFSVWEMQMGFTGLSNATVSNRGAPLDTAKSPKELGLKDDDVLTVVPGERSKQPGGHDFSPANFNQPTNCALCKKFIWGLYNQGKKCAKCWAPVHHRCAEQYTQMCEASMRQSLGLNMADFNNSEDAEDETNIPEGYPIQQEDLMDWASLLTEESSPENDKNFMKTFDKFSNFTDDEIGKIWSKYDADGNGSLDKQEMKVFVCDLLGALAGGTDAKAVEATVDRVMTAMDTNRDGSIQWEEFYYFYKAQQDNKFLGAFKGIKLTKEKLYEMWYHYDADNSGVLEADEVLRLLQDCASIAGGTNTTSQYKGQLESFFGPSKRVTWEEFCSTLVPLIQDSIDADL
jgi:Ca2+-binding EF-hand superfamily protein